MKIRQFIYPTILALLFGVFAKDTLAQTRSVNRGEHPRYSLYVPPHQVKFDSPDLHYPPQELRALKKRSLVLLDDISRELQRLLGQKLNQGVVLRILSPRQFGTKFAAPEWTSAMYYRGEIVLALGPRVMRRGYLQRTLRHEYVHAALAELSGGSSPAWLEEGLAQIFSGPIHSKLASELRRELESHGPRPLGQLDQSFTLIPQSQVVAAYGQSLFAVQTLINRFGFAGLRLYLELLSRGGEHEVAFELAFETPLSEFEGELARQLELWANSGRELG